MLRLLRTGTSSASTRKHHVLRLHSPSTSPLPIDIGFKPFGYSQLEEFLALPVIQESLKDNFRIASPVCTPELTFQERQETIGETLFQMADRWANAKSKDKNKNPLVGFHSVPGGGKSHLVDRFLALNLNEGLY